MPLLKHGCAELASAHHTNPAKRVFHQLMVIGKSRSFGSILKNAAGAFSSRLLVARKR
ncbi:MAG: hypothetical protein ACYCYO_17345 [Bacilli bacterium]